MHLPFGTIAFRLHVYRKVLINGVLAKCVAVVPIVRTIMGDIRYAKKIVIYASYGVYISRLKTVFCGAVRLDLAEDYGPFLPMELPTDISADEFVEYVFLNGRVYENLQEKLREDRIAREMKQEIETKLAKLLHCN